jgi:hypothetical protein
MADHSSRQPSLIVTVIRQFVIGHTTFEAEIQATQRTIDQKQEILAWNTVDQSGELAWKKVLRIHYQILALEHELAKLNSWSDELSMIEATLNSIMAQ